MKISLIFSLLIVSLSHRINKVRLATCEFDYKTILSWFELLATSICIALSTIIIKDLVCFATNGVACVSF